MWLIPGNIVSERVLSIDVQKESRCVRDWMTVRGVLKRLNDKYCVIKGP